MIYRRRNPSRKGTNSAKSRLGAPALFRGSANFQNSPGEKRKGHVLRAERRETHPTQPRQKTIREKGVPTPARQVIRGQTSSSNSTAMRGGEQKEKTPPQRKVYLTRGLLKKASYNTQPPRGRTTKTTVKKKKPLSLFRDKKTKKASS